MLRYTSGKSSARCRARQCQPNRAGDGSEGDFAYFDKCSRCARSGENDAVGAPVVPVRCRVCAAARDRAGGLSGIVSGSPQKGQDRQSSGFHAHKPGSTNASVRTLKRARNYGRDERTHILSRSGIRHSRCARGGLWSNFRDAQLGLDGLWTAFRAMTNPASMKKATCSGEGALDQHTR